MANNQYTILRRIFPTAHKLSLDKQLSQHLKALKGNVLVLGAGYVDYQNYMPKADNITNTDIEATGDHIHLVCDAHNLPFSNEQFDVVVAIEVFEHLHTPSVAINEVLRVLKPNGKLLVSIPFLFRVHGDPSDYQRFTEFGLKQLFKNFKIQHLFIFGGRMHVISDLFTTMSRLFFPLRIINHIICFFDSILKSRDSPSGYIVLGIK